MPSDTRFFSALEALAGPREAFRSALGTAVDQVAAFLEGYRAPENGRLDRMRVELGSFAAGRIDSQRFAALFTQQEALEPFARAAIERSFETLHRLAERGEAIFVCHVPPGRELRDCVARALAEAGRAFGAARAVELARAGRYTSEVLDSVGGFPFRRWNRAERQIAPPLVVEVTGGALQVGGLAEFLDGAQKLILLVRGPAPPAPLVRLITPGVFVLQTTDESELAQLAAIPGPGVAALLPEGAARFVHRPTGGELRERLDIQHIPKQTPRASIGAVSAFQQREELTQLQALAVGPPSLGPSPRKQGEEGTADAAALTGLPPLPPRAGGEGGGDEGGPAGGDPADRLAAWLLSQADLGGAG
jgi:hypothetical protein